ncbi:MAG: esterase [Acidobacteriia bacterium]|nr:esterase [Terriglobia bacterium]
MARGSGILLFMTLLTVTAPVAVAQTTMTWTIDGIQRQALVFAPMPATNAHKIPLVFAFHGHGGTMQSAAQGMHLETLWPGAVIVYPQGLKTPSRVDPQGKNFGWQVQAGQAGLDNRDLKFFDAMVVTMHEKFPVDDARIYATGFSNGAIFSYLLWAERGKTLAAFGIVAGRLDPAEHLTLPRAVVVIGGTNDNILPFALQQQTINLDRPNQ